MDLSAINPAVLIASLDGGGGADHAGGDWRAGGGKGRRAEPWGRGHDDHGRDLRLCDRGRNRQPGAGLCRRARWGRRRCQLIFAVLTQVLLANQVATGLALTLFGLGLSSLIGQGYVGIKPPATGTVPLGPLADIPGLGRDPVQP